MSYRPPSVTLAVMRQESLQVARLWLEVQDWKVVRERVLQDKFFPQRSLTGQKRAFAEVRYRLQHLEPSELQALVAEEEILPQRLWVHLAACRAYHFLQSFSRNVLREKIKVYDWELRESDFIRHWEEEALDHPELERLSQVSRKDIGRAILRFLTEVGLVTGSPARNLNPLVPPLGMVQEVIHQPGAWLETLMLEDSQIQALLENHE